MPALTFKQPKCPSVDEWIKKAVVHLYNGTLLSSKKEILTFAIFSRMDLESIRLSEISWSEQDKYHVIDVTYMWILMNKTM